MWKLLAVPFVAAMIAFSSGQAQALPTQNVGMIQDVASGATLAAHRGNPVWRQYPRYQGQYRAPRYNYNRYYGNRHHYPRYRRYYGVPNLGWNYCGWGLGYWPNGCFGDGYYGGYLGGYYGDSYYDRRYDRHVSASPTRNMSSGARRGTRPTIRIPTPSSARERRNIAVTALTMGVVDQVRRLH